MLFLIKRRRKKSVSIYTCMFNTCAWRLRYFKSKIFSCKINIKVQWIISLLKEIFENVRRLLHIYEMVHKLHIDKTILSHCAHSANWHQLEIFNDFLSITCIRTRLQYAQMDPWEMLCLLFPYNSLLFVYGNDLSCTVNVHKTGFSAYYLDLPRLSHSIIKLLPLFRISKCFNIEKKKNPQQQTENIVCFNFLYGGGGC